METQHTQGPWLDWETLEWRVNPRDLLTRTADARLIAAAPELLEACEYALAIAEDRLGGTWDDVMLTMRAVIAKARGEGE